MSRPPQATSQIRVALNAEVVSLESEVADPDMRGHAPLISPPKVGAREYYGSSPDGNDVATA